MNGLARIKEMNDIIISLWGYLSNPNSFAIGTSTEPYSYASEETYLQLLFVSCRFWYHTKNEKYALQSNIEFIPLNKKWKQNHSHGKQKLVVMGASEYCHSVQFPVYEFGLGHYTVNDCQGKHEICFSWSVTRVDVGIAVLCTGELAGCKESVSTA